ncbi:unnamed protein product, partial [Gulo gulo]
SSPGLAARRPRRVLLARIPASPDPQGPSVHTPTWVSRPGLLSHPHEVPDVQLAHRVGHTQTL